jgi:hypothetical protein
MRKKGMGHGKEGDVSPEEARRGGRERSMKQETSLTASYSLESENKGVCGRQTAALPAVTSEPPEYFYLFDSFHRASGKKGPCP